MTLEELVFKTLTNNVGLQPKLGTYSETPAVFAVFPPSDEDVNWGDKFPHLIYQTSLRDDPVRRVSGTLSIDIVSLDTIEDGPEEIELLIRGAIDNTFFETDLGTICLKWKNSMPFNQNDEEIGLTMVMDIYAFPRQTMPSSPVKSDPIAALNTWIKSYLGVNSAYYIEGTAQSVDVWTPTSTKPAIYWRIETKGVSIISAAIVKVKATCTLHVMAPLGPDRHIYLMNLGEQLAVQGLFTMPNGAPFVLFDNISIKTGADSVSNGQITIQGDYYMDRRDYSGTPINHIYNEVTV